ncbi:MAG: thioredoxin [bacterium]|nr:thioredoxin [bacterium]MDA1024478.1 thioredoxin [bacterium]
MDLTNDTFQQFVLQAETPVLIDFHAPWCGPCKVMGPIIEQLAEEMEGVAIGKVNADDHLPLVREYNIMSLPTFLIFKGGKEVDRFSGTKTAEELKARLESHM